MRCMSVYLIACALRAFMQQKQLGGARPQACCILLPAAVQVSSPWCFGHTNWVINRTIPCHPVRASQTGIQTSLRMS